MGKSSLVIWLLLFVADPVLGHSARCYGQANVWAVSEEVTLGEKIDWLKEHGLYYDTLSDTQIERRYTVFSNMVLGDL